MSFIIKKKQLYLSFILYINKEINKAISYIRVLINELTIEIYKFKKDLNFIKRNKFQLFKNDLNLFQIKLNIIRFNKESKEFNLFYIEFIFI